MSGLSDDLTDDSLSTHGRPVTHAQAGDVYCMLGARTLARTWSDSASVHVTSIRGPLQLRTWQGSCLMLKYGQAGIGSAHRLRMAAASFSSFWRPIMVLASDRCTTCNMSQGSGQLPSLPGAAHSSFEVRWHGTRCTLRAIVCMLGRCLRPSRAPAKRHLLAQVQQTGTMSPQLRSS